MFSLYSSAQVGIFGSIVRKTNVDKILQLNCNATDFYQKNDFPTYLYYNPYGEAREIRYYNERKGATDLYDALTQERLVESLQHEGTFTIPAKAARLVVAVPAGTELKAPEKNYAMAAALVSEQLKQDQ
jgi:hypothetical protein